MSDLLHTRGEQALEAVRSKLAELERQEEAAIAAGDAEAAVQRRGERLMLEEAALMLLASRAAAEQRRQKPPAVTGLTREKVIAAAIAGREPGPDGTWPTQPAVAAALGYADARRIRQVQGKGGWSGILADAAKLVGG